MGRVIPLRLSRHKIGDARATSPVYGGGTRAKQKTVNWDSAFCFCSSPIYGEVSAARSWLLTEGDPPSRKFEALQSHPSVSPDLRIREPHDLDPVQLEVRGAVTVSLESFGCEMLCAVQLDAQA
jgi:hypothetical protein